MKRLVFLILVIFGFVISVQAADVPRSESVSFWMEFTRSGRSVLSFINNEPADIPFPANAVIEKADPVSFGEITKVEDLVGKDNLEASVALYWDVYGDSFSLKLSFVDSSGYMLRNTKNVSQGYNYQVHVSSSKINGFKDLCLFDKDVPSEPISSDNVISIIANNTPVNGRTYGSVTLNLSLPVPKDNFITGQYTGLIRVNMVVND